MSTTTGRACATTCAKRSSSASTPIDRIRVSVRIPDWGCRFQSRSSMPMAARSGSRTAPARRDRTASRACSAPASSCACRRCNALRPAAHSRASGNPEGVCDAMVESVGPRFCGDERMRSATVHASAVLVGARAVLIRGASGAGKSRLAFDLILAGRSGQIPPTRLVGDDRVHLQAVDGKLIVRPAPALAGLIEVRGLGIQNCDFVNEAIVGLVVDLDAEDAERLPKAEALRVRTLGIELPR